jgi:hypothetical protein
LFSCVFAHQRGVAVVQWAAAFTGCLRGHTFDGFSYKPTMVIWLGGWGKSLARWHLATLWGSILRSFAWTFRWLWGCLRPFALSVARFRRCLHPVVWSFFWFCGYLRPFLRSLFRLCGCMLPFAWSFLVSADVCGRSCGRSAGCQDVCGRLRGSPQKSHPRGQLSLFTLFQQNRF